MFLKLDDCTNTKQNKQYTINSGLLLGGNIVIFFGSTAPRRAILMFQCTTVAAQKNLSSALWLAPKSMAIYGTQFFYDPNFQRKPHQYFFALTYDFSRLDVKQKRKPILVPFQYQSQHRKKNETYRTVLGPGLAQFVFYMS